MISIKLKTKELSSTLSKLLRMLDKKSIEPISNFVFFKPEKEGFFLCASDGKISLKRRIDAEGMEGEKGFGIPHKKFLNLLKVSGEDIQLVFDEENMWVNVVGDKFKSSIPGIPEDMLAVDFTTPSSKTSINFLDLSLALKKVIYASPNESSTYGIDGVKVIVDSGKIISMATDGFLLALYEKDFEGDAAPISFVIPKKIARSISSFFDAGEIHISKRDSEVCFSMEDTILISPTIEDRFPDSILDVKNRRGESVLTIPKDELEKSFRTAKMFNEKKTGARLLLSAREGIKLLVEEEQGRLDFSLEGNYAGEDMELVLDEKGMLDVIANLEQPNVNIELFGSRNPIMVRENGDNYIYVNLITPLSEEGEL